MKKILAKIIWYLFYISLLFIPSQILANIDEWYANNPSCVIDRGNPGRTGEYIDEPLEKKPVSILDITNNRAIMGSGRQIFCAKSFIITKGPTVAYENQKNSLWNDVNYFGDYFSIYKDFIYALT